MLTHKAYKFYAMTNRMVRTQDVKMGLTDLSDSRCVSVVLIKASLVLLSCMRFFPFDKNLVRPLVIVKGNAHIY